MRDDIVISGIGLLTAFGRGTGAYWRGLVEGRSALAPARRFAADCYRGEAVGEISGFPAGGPARKQAYTLAAAEDALRAAGLGALPDRSLVVLVGQSPLRGDGGLREEQDEFMGPVPAGVLEGGHSVHITQACASTVFAISLGRDALRSGAATTVVVAGGTALNRYEYASMAVVRAIDRTAARPFDTGRAGISLGEGGGAIVLEHGSTARARGLAPDTVVAGAACRVSAGKAVASDADVVAGCLRDALDDAGVEHADYVHAHATGTPQGDAAELRAIEEVSGRTGTRSLPVSSHKGAVGHLLHISGVPAVAAAAMALRTGVVPPTPGLSAPEETRRVVLPRSALPVPGMAAAVVNSFGFGGNNASLVLRRS
ncbi:3-oxoacyl-ACP synthase [Streptomyces sp. S07_1.15]|uniref:beta-ketoacyl synthase N-terminal-like domain-containing protein n=1 Tax=Streptomyces sp. S07_1.15 TaxID=2873925 RepID=UPI001D149D57|nr:beta-ketoacyl synthase N-terminal-like domain-containing protein [Streptomyces sp. S07_1.15]MCC3651635.1 3-oxoacyl-ACP synthase [Streptomyces sp. S07_1.15]